jgi:S-adenosylmethionine hydrolase
VNQIYDRFNNVSLNRQIEQMRQVEKEINDEVNRKIHYDAKSELRKEYLKTKAEQPLNSNCFCG